MPYIVYSAEEREKKNTEFRSYGGARVIEPDKKAKHPVGKFNFYTKNTLSEEVLNFELWVFSLNFQFNQDSRLANPHLYAILYANNYSLFTDD